MSAEIRNKVRAFFGSELQKKEIGDEDSLLLAGIIDSLRMLDLITYLESEFGVEIDDEELMPDNFDSIDAIVAFLHEKEAA